MSEVFNRVLKGARSLLITALVQMTFYRVNSYFVARRSMAKERLEAGFIYTPNPTITIEKNLLKSAFHVVTPFDDEQRLFEVKTGRGNRPLGKGGNVHSVNLVKKTCTCEKYKIYKLPCSHVLAVCGFRSMSFADVTLGFPSVLHDFGFV
ncbi:unnamed protein product [Amaranthus hypochondriacus]